MTTNPENPQPGEIVTWDANPENTHGHVEIITQETVEGAIRRVAEFLRQWTRPPMAGRSGTISGIYTDKSAEMADLEVADLQLVLGAAEPARAGGKQWRIWHIPQIPGKAFEVDVETPAQGRLLLDGLAEYDLFLLENNHRVDYSNAQGLQYLDEDGDWVDCDDDELEELGLA